MADEMEFDTRSRYDINLLAAVSIPIAVAPFSYLFGILFIVHFVSSEARAVWMSTVILTSLTITAYWLFLD
ncbi:hypothetical protein [Haloarcula sediminis]|uniref:hypothetical protein n=1 Tax=Haloarcula sediminis TaxID=3111777 RepID=UPI002D7735FE|nr:hypothetical protein [Haloarcula sp. CK38]